MTALSTSRSVRLLPRFLYVLVWLPRIPIPILVFIPTLVLEGLAYLAEALARRWSRPDWASSVTRGPSRSSRSSCGKSAHALWCGSRSDSAER